MRDGVPRVAGSARVRLRAVLIAALLPFPAACKTMAEPDSPSRFTDEEIEYFLEIALGAEYGNVEPVIRKWTSDIRIAVRGAPTDQDQGTLHTVVTELNELVRGFSIGFDQQNPNVEIHFAPETSFDSILPQYVLGNAGFFWVWYNPVLEIYRAVILIDSERIPQDLRSHLIREEVTQILGLMHDSWRDPESIFYQGHNTTQHYTPTDRQLIRMLHLPEIQPGMDSVAVVAALRN